MRPCLKMVLCGSCAWYTVAVSLSGAMVCLDVLDGVMGAMVSGGLLRGEVVAVVCGLRHLIP